MPATAYSNGHKICYDDEEKIWKYEDNGADIEKEARRCSKCEKLPTKEGYDSCIGYIPGLKSACCGHGVEEPYGVTTDGGYVKLNEYSAPKEEKPKLQVMISQPMAGKTEQLIREERQTVVQKLIDHGYEVMDTIVQDEPDDSCKCIPLYYLAKSIEFMAQADIVYFMPGWENARGCHIEYDAALAYGKSIIRTQKGEDDICQI